MRPGVGRGERRHHGYFDEFGEQIDSVTPLYRYVYEK